MSLSTLVSPSELNQHLQDPAWRIVDCRFKLADPESGRRDYLMSHIPGAVYAHLNEDLSGPILPGKTGRHPLPEVSQAARVFSRLGIRTGIQVVAYDDLGGSMAAARLWWMLRWLGHAEAAVLDGGWHAWLADGRPVQQEVPHVPPANFIPRPGLEQVVTAQDVDQIRADPGYCLLDARSFERYLGLNETIDLVGGHIPGAVSAPYSANLTSEGRFKTKDELARHYWNLLGDRQPGHAVFYCGSGVTAVLNILAMEYAGLTGARLYAGSWSEWITDPLHPIARQDQSSI
jgi:thiosulfate/3-mercaptopyruvate sulfurtransferase